MLLSLECTRSAHSWRNFGTIPRLHGTHHPRAAHHPRRYHASSRSQGSGAQFEFDSQLPAASAAGAPPSFASLPSTAPTPTVGPKEDLDEWEARRQEVEAFIHRYARMPRQLPSPELGLAEGEEQLGRWCTVQHRRRDRSSGAALSAKQRARLDATPGWRWGPGQQEVRKRLPWDERRRQLEAFAAQHGRLPRQLGGRQQPLLPGERQLGKWCDAQRQRQKGHGSQKPLTPHQVAVLDAFPLWLWEEYRVENWEGRCARLAAFVEREGRLPCSPDNKRGCLLAGEAELDRWALHQRQRLKGHVEGALLPWQVAALEAVPGWEWDGTRQEEWQARYKQLEGFVRRHGRLPRATPLLKQREAGEGLEEGEAALYFWCARQRLRGDRPSSSQQKPLLQEQVDALNALPGWYW